MRKEIEKQPLSDSSYFGLRLITFPHKRWVTLIIGISECKIE